MLKKTILALCEVNVKYNNKLEISGSLHVRSDGGRVFTLLIDEEVMNLANKRDRDFSQGQGHPYAGAEHRGSNGSLKSVPQINSSSSTGRRSSVSSIGGVQLPETSSSSGLQHTMAPAGKITGQRVNQPGFEREAQSLSSTVPDVGNEVTDESSVTSQHNRYSRPSSVDSHSMGLAAAGVTTADNAMETGRAGSTLDAIVSNLHSAAMELELGPSHNHGHENEENADTGNHGNNANANSHLNHNPSQIAMQTSYNNVNNTDATSPINSTSPKNGGTQTGNSEEDHSRVVKVEPTEIPSSSGAPATVPPLTMPQMMVSPMANANLDHKAALKLAPVEHVKGGNKKWQCVFCGILVSSKFYLSSHINAVHTRTRIYPCEICGKMFYSHGAQRIHKLRNHWVEKRHKCPFCGQLFVLPFELRQHVQKKHRGQTEATAQQSDQKNASTM